MVIGLTAGCASTQPAPTEASTSGISAAEAVGAANEPQASLDLQVAKEDLERANAASKGGEKKTAE